METGLTANRLVSELTRSVHGKLEEYLPVGKQAAKELPELLAHLISWDRLHGQVRDSQVALPVISLSAPIDQELAENAQAHIALLSPKEFLRAFRFAKQVKTPGYGMALDRLLERYLRFREDNWPLWERSALQHRTSMKEMYALGRVRPSDKAEKILFLRQYPKGSVFETVARLKIMSPQEAAGAIIERRIPFLIARGAMGAGLKEPEAVLALIERMSPTELVTNTKFLEKLGVKTTPALRGAFEQALEKAGKSGKKTALKASRAAAAEGLDEGLSQKLQALQEKQIDSMKGIEGDWLVLADKSGSMSVAIETARQVAGTLTRFVKGRVHLVFFDTAPQGMEVTGQTLEQIQKKTRLIQANGGTSIGCGVRWAIDKGIPVDGIAVVSDAAENTPPLFVEQYATLCESLGKAVPVYLYRCQVGASGMDQDLARSMKARGLDLQEFDLRGHDVDYYSLPNLVSTMKTNRYGLQDEILETPLLTLKQVFNVERKEEVVHA